MVSLKQFIFVCSVTDLTLAALRLLSWGTRRPTLQQRQTFASWQSSTHTAQHLAALRRQRKIMNEEQTDSPPPVEDGQERKKPQFGTRFLTDPKNVFQHNAWDNVVWDQEQEAEARKTTLEQLQHSLPIEKQEEYEREADLYWDKFYNQHQNRFFKDRHWLFTEFPELYSSKGNTNPETCVTSHASPDTKSAPGETQQSGVCEASQSAEVSPCPPESQADAGAGAGSTDTATESSTVDGEEPARISVEAGTPDTFPGRSATFRVLEVGCGVGNTIFPVLSTNNDPGLMVYCCDFSSTAVQLVKEHRDYDPKRCHAFVWDITDVDAQLPFPPESLDIVIMIFVLSAVHPEKMQRAVDSLARCLKPGGQLLLRDYGRYDMAQLRFKKGRCLSENFYVRGDGTRVYFFTQEELRNMLQQAGLVETQNLIDRRLQVNRGRQLKMYRVWIQCKYTKPATLDSTSASDSIVCRQGYDSTAASDKTVCSQGDGAQGASV